MLSTNPQFADCCNLSGQRVPRSIVERPMYSIAVLAVLLLFGCTTYMTMFGHGGAPDVRDQSLFSIQSTLDKVDGSIDGFLNWVAVQYGEEPSIVPKAEHIGVLQRLASGSIQVTKAQQIVAEALLVAATAKGAAGLLTKGKNVVEAEPITNVEGQSVWTSAVDTAGAGLAGVVNYATSIWASLVDIAVYSWTTVVHVAVSIWALMVDAAVYSWTFIAKAASASWVMVGNAAASSWISIVDVAQYSSTAIVKAAAYTWATMTATASQLAQKLPLDTPVAIALAIVAGTILAAGLGFVVYRFATGGRAPEKQSLLPITEVSKEPIKDAPERLVTAWMTRLGAVVSKGFGAVCQGVTSVIPGTSKKAPQGEEQQPVVAGGRLEKKPLLPLTQTPKPAVVTEAPQPAGLLARLTSKLARSSASAANEATKSIPAVADIASVPRPAVVLPVEKVDVTPVLKYAAAGRPPPLTAPIPEPQPQLTRRFSLDAMQASVTVPPSQSSIMNYTSSTLVQPNPTTTTVRRTSLSDIRTPLKATGSAPGTPTAFNAIRTTLVAVSPYTTPLGSPLSSPVTSVGGSAFDRISAIRSASPYASPSSPTTPSRKSSAAPQQQSSPLARTSSQVYASYRPGSAAQPQASSPLPRKNSQVYASPNSSPLAQRPSASTLTSKGSARYIRRADGSLQREP